jgi:putative membrane protein
MGYGSGYMMGGMHGLWWLFWLVLLGVIVFAIGGWGRWGGQRNRSRERHRDTPHELLYRRLANGNITPAEYEERKSLLDRDASLHQGET